MEGYNLSNIDILIDAYVSLIRKQIDFGEMELVLRLKWKIID
jgi:hypothetical protein